MGETIDAYGMIGDLRTAALVSETGRLAWLSWPDFDSQACFASWSPRFQSPPLPNSLPATASAAAFHGQVLFHDKACEYCHEINGLGGIRGPDLSNVGNRLTRQDIIIRILNGGKNMPAFAGILHPDQVADLVAYLETRKTYPGPNLTQAR